MSNPDHLSDPDLKQLIPDSKDMAGVITQETADQLRGSIDMSNFKSLAQMYSDPAKNDGFYISESQQNGQDTFTFHNSSTQADHLANTSTMGLIKESKGKMLCGSLGGAALAVVAAHVGSVMGGAMGVDLGVDGAAVLGAMSAPEIIGGVAAAAVAGVAIAGIDAAVEYNAHTTAQRDLAAGLDVSVSFPSSNTASPAA